MSFLDDEAPWGSPVDTSIPLPPFRHTAEHARYTRMLQLHLALLDGGGPSLPTIALSAALDASRRTDLGATLSELELAVSLTTWFPVPWTLAALAEALSSTAPDAPRPLGSRWTWLYDPDFLATPAGSGAWTVDRRERGSIDREAVASDRDLVVLWLSHFRERFAFPLGHGYDPADLASLAGPSAAVLRADEADAVYPYRASWREERSAALDSAVRPD